MEKTKFLHDIVNGEYYQQILQSDNFFKSPFNITFTMKTYGVQIFLHQKLIVGQCFLQLNDFQQ